MTSPGAHGEGEAVTLWAYRALPVAAYNALLARANTAKGDADLMRARAERAEALLKECRDHIPLVDPCPDHAIDDKECQPGIERADLLSRLDDALGGAS